MKLQLVGCSHHTAPIEVRERLAFSREQIPVALARLRDRLPACGSGPAFDLQSSGAVHRGRGGGRRAKRRPDSAIPGRISTDCAAEDIAGELFWRKREDAVRHLFRVAASLDSMVMGEAQILSQVKEAYQLATEGEYTGPVMHAAFQAAMRVARRVAKETAIHQKRVSIPSVAVADFASQIFERFDDKQVLVIGAGEMGRETLRYLMDSGAKTCHARQSQSGREPLNWPASSAGGWRPGIELDALLVEADLVDQHHRSRGAGRVAGTISGGRKTPATSEPCSSSTWPSPAISIRASATAWASTCIPSTTCRRRASRTESSGRKNGRKAQRIIDLETERFLAEWNHRLTGPAIRQLKASVGCGQTAGTTAAAEQVWTIWIRKCASEIEISFDRLVNKLLHPPLGVAARRSREGHATRIAGCPQAPLSTR